MEKLKTVFSGLKTKKLAIGLAIVGLVGAGTGAHYLMEEVEEVQPATIVGRAGDVPVAIKGLEAQFAMYNNYTGPYNRLSKPVPIRTYDSPLRAVAFYRETPREGLPPPATIEERTSKEWNETHRLVMVGFNWAPDTFLNKELKVSMDPEDERARRLLPPYQREELNTLLPGFDMYTRSWESWASGKDIESLLFVKRTEKGELRTVIACPEVESSKLDEALCTMSFIASVRNG